MSRQQHTPQGIRQGFGNFDANKLTKSEVQKVQKESHELMKYLVEHLQRVRGKELERAKIRVKHGDKYGEVILFDKNAFIIHDLDAKEKEITKATIKKDGSLHKLERSSIEEKEQVILISPIRKTVVVQAVRR